MWVSSRAGVHLAHCSHLRSATVLTPQQQDLCVKAEKAELRISRCLIADGIVYCAGWLARMGWKVALNILVAPEAPPATADLFLV